MRRDRLQQGDAGAFHRDVSPGAHGDADLGCGQCGASLTPSPAMATIRRPFAVAYHALF